MRRRKDGNKYKGAAKKVKQKDAVKNSGPVTSTGPPKDHGLLYYSLCHAVSTECFEMSETEAGIMIMYRAVHRVRDIYIYIRQMAKIY